MPLKEFVPTSAGVRFKIAPTFEEITKAKPEKRLVKIKKKRGGRNSQGKITVRRRGGGHKQKYRIIDWKRDKDGVPAKVVAIEYDPNRYARLALLSYLDGEKRYIICPVDLKVGDIVTSGPESEIKPGNALPIENIPVGTVIHNIELTPGKGAQLVRSAGAAAQLMAKDNKFAHIRLPSGEVRLVSVKCKATIGQVGNVEREGISIGKAGANRWRGRRPKVRGVAMNPCDHPHGGGEARSTPGRPSSTPWAKPALGRKTRKPKHSDKMIVKRRRE